MNITKITFAFFRLLAVCLIAAHLSACEKGQPAERDKTFEDLMAEREKQRQKPMPKCREAQAGGPAEVVRRLYREYPIGGRTAVTNEPREVLDKFFDKRFAELLEEDNACTFGSGGLCEINWDILYATQDGEDITDFQICEMDADKHTVKVQFREYGGPKLLIYKLGNTESGWRISDLIDATDGHESSLADFLADHYGKLAAAWEKVQAPEPPAAPGEKRMPLPQCERAKAGGPEDLVRTLYEQYPWKGDKIINAEPSEVLAKYFDESLAAAFVNARQCGFPCAAVPNLMIDRDMESVGKEITGFHICAMEASTKAINVQFRNEGAPTIVTYKMSETTAGWRISDILYTDLQHRLEPNAPYDWSMMKEFSGNARRPGLKPRAGGSDGGSRAQAER